MALPQSALSELLETSRTGDGVDLLRHPVRSTLRELIEREAPERLGAAPYAVMERIPGGSTAHPEGLVHVNRSDRVVI